MGQHLIDEISETNILSKAEKPTETISEYSVNNNIANNQNKVSLQRQSFCTNINYQINSTNPSSVSSASSSSTSSLSSPNSFQITTTNNNSNHNEMTTALNYTNCNESRYPYQDAQHSIKFEVENSNHYQTYSSSDCKSFESTKEIPYGLNGNDKSISLVKTLNYVGYNGSLLFDAYDCKSKFVTFSKHEALINFF